MPEGWNKERSQEIERTTGLRCISAWTAMDRALTAIGARRIAIGSPYPASIHRLAVAYFRKSGFDVVADATLDVSAVRDVPNVSQGTVVELAVSIAPDADAIVLLATDLPTFDAIGIIESQADRPLLSCNQTILWAALGQRGVHLTDERLGRLFKHQPVQEFVR
jgi:maleate isomerase